ncbi:hypothetical protein ABZV34_27140 [Streptomyces sp. NPDC005195]|uniref:hypothetical protein n=1 Tax=Streptomyces sp. NPDC005195 TaxID=3154561 RepID=UPI0033BF1EF1
MSTGLECQFIEVKHGQWYYVLEDGDAPKGAFDWREYATAYGPFTTHDAAADHLITTHANPGGYEICRYTDGFEPDTVLAALLADSRL